MSQNRFSQEEISLCTYIALYDSDAFSTQNIYDLFDHTRTLDAYDMKVQNIVAMLDYHHINRNGRITPLSGTSAGSPPRSTNWELVEPLTQLTREALLERCNQIFEHYSSEEQKEERVLEDLHNLSEALSSRYAAYSPSNEVRLPQSFKNRYRELLNASSMEVEFSEYTTLIKSVDGLMISCPNQWFYIASFFPSYITALEEYKVCFYNIFSTLKAPQKKAKISHFRESASINDEDMKKITNYFDNEEDVTLFVKFLTDYEWWNGSKTIDRGDYYHSPILKLANVVNVSQGYIADIAYDLAMTPELLASLSEAEIVVTELNTVFELINTEKGSLQFPFKNILLKGVPGTGKSHLIDKIITDEDKLGLEKNDHNVLRINIHSASSNADLMQGIGIATERDQIIYKEKQGLILNHIRKAIASPMQPFVIVLEEIQENSLNELIGDLIYLIEDKKRTVLSSEASSEFDSMEEFVEDYIRRNPQTYYVEIPYLVSTETGYKKMLLPNNLFIFCTSNYRDDKKVIEDNLLRRFEVIEVYPAYKETIGSAFKSQAVSDFLKKLNEKILSHFHDNGEIHPDRFMIGHAIWLDIEDDDRIAFYATLLKVVTEFKDIKELDFESDLKQILSALDSYPFGISKSYLIKNNYKEQVDYLQQQCYSDLFGTTGGSGTSVAEASEMVSGSVSADSEEQEASEDAEQLS